MPNPHDKVSIRQAVLAEIPVLLKSRIALLEEVGEVIEGDDHSGLIKATQEYLERNLGQSCLTFIAEVNGEIVGTGTLELFNRMPYYKNFAGSEAYVLNIYTRPAYRNHGIGSSMIRELIACAHDRGVEKLWLHPTQAGSLIYRKEGFQPRNGEMELFL